MNRRNFASGAALCLVTHSLTSFSQSRDRTVSTGELERDRKTALEILDKLDKVPLTLAALNELYLSSGIALQRRYKVKEFDLRLRAIRGPLGSVSSRRFAGYSGSYATLPNIVPGDYVIIGFETEFSELLGKYTEQVTLEKDRSGGDNSRLVEYYVAPIVETEVKPTE